MRVELFLLGFIVIASGCLHAAEPTQNNNPNETSSPSEIDYSDTRNIYFTGSGFAPADLTIEQGDTVTWIKNASSTGMWVASDEHPTHTNYHGSTLREHCQNGDQTTAAFDQCSQGEEFSFTFEKTGKWSYHNHQPYAEGGTITVR